MQNDLPIGVFDSGVGGLTVLQALQKQLPKESFIYFGDTARLPYGTKSPETVIQYALHAGRLLDQQGIKALVVACNTASSVSLPHLQAEFPHLTVIGVLNPGAFAAHCATKNHSIALLATESTIKTGAYHRALVELHPEVKLVTQACSLLVALAEEGWVDDEITESVVRRYIEPLVTSHPQLDCLLLGCTHFPVLLPTIQRVLPPHITIVDSAHATAIETQEQLQLLNKTTTKTKADPTRFLVSDSPERFSKVAQYFLNQKIDPKEVEWLVT